MVKQSQTKQIKSNEVLLKNTSLQNASYSLLKNILIFRSGSIETSKKAKDFLKIIKEVSPTSRVLSCQVNTPEDEWELIQKQHRQLVTLNNEWQGQGSIAHLNFPIISKNPEEEFVAKAITKLYRQLNIEGWTLYSDWLNEEIEKVLKTFKPEAVDEYQLQARLEDFKIETYSLFSKEIKKELNHTLMSMMRIEEDQKKEREMTLFSLEKRVVSLREHLRKGLQIKYVLLNEIVKGISVIEVAHPELVPLKSMSFLLATLLGQEIGAVEDSPLSWDQQLSLLQILNQQLGVMTAINCHNGSERTHKAFSLMLDVAEKASKVTSEELIPLFLN